MARSRRAWVVGTIVVVVVLAANAVAVRDLFATHASVAHTRRQESATLARLRTSQARLAAVVSEVAATRDTLTIRRGERDRLRSSLSLTVSALQAARDDLGAAYAHVVAQSGQITVLTTCLQGVSQAMNGLSVGDGAHGLQALRSVADACQRAANIGSAA